MRDINIVFYMGVLVASGITSFLCVPLLKRIASRFDYVDKPDERHKTHLKAVPYLGGLAIVIPAALLAVIGYWLDLGAGYNWQTLFFFVPTMIISLVGFIDDKVNLGYKSKLIIQVSTSIYVSLALVSEGFLTQLSDLYIINVLLSMFWIVIVTNAFNFIDNIDGAVAGLSIITSSTIFIHAALNGQTLIAVYSLCILGGSVGFLRWNISPASIYLGDGGALFLGITFSILLLQLEPATNSLVASVSLPVLIACIPIIDFCVVVASRLSKKASIFQGGKDHLSHRLQSKGLTKDYTVGVLWIIHTIFCLMSLSFNLVSDTTEIRLASLCLIILFLIGLAFSKFKELEG